MTITVWPVNAVGGSPAYSGKTIRQAQSVAMSGATSARPLGTQSGVRFGTPTDTVSVSGSTVTIKPHAGILDKQASAAAGPYMYAIDANETKTLDAAHGTHPRIDIITVRLDDPAESDGSSNPAVVVVYKAGTAAASPATPTPATSRELILATIAVPQSGGGSAVVTWVAPYTVAAGAVVPVRDTTERDALATAVGPTTHAPLYVHRVDATAGRNLECTMDGTTWYVVDARDTGWIAMSVGSGYTGSLATMVRVIGDVVYVRGQIDKNSGNVASGDTLGTLPVGARPSSSSRAVSAVGSAASTMKLTVSTAGVITVSSTPSSTTTYARVDFSFAI